MGGLVMRYWATRDDYRDETWNYGDGFINRMITLGTPHFGSPQAILSLDPGAACLRDIGAFPFVRRYSLAAARISKATPFGALVLDVPGAALELSGDGIGTGFLSDALSGLLNQDIPFPMFSIAGDITPILDRLDPVVTSLFPTIFDPNIRPDNPDGLGESRKSDGAVPLSSALMNSAADTCLGTFGCVSGFAHGKGTSLFFGVSTDHLVDSSQRVGEMVLRWLNTPVFE
jgi:hypothetical protein